MDKVKIRNLLELSMEEIAECAERSQIIAEKASLHEVYRKLSILFEILQSELYAK